MKQKPLGRRYRPILRMNDLLHPTQQRERMADFGAPDEPIGRYHRYSRLWTVATNAALCVVKVPNAVRRLDEETYRVLMQQRLSSLIQQWLRDNGCTQAEGQRLLLRYLLPSDRLTEADVPERLLVDWDAMDSAGAIAPLRQWSEDWADFWVRSGDRLVEIAQHSGTHFPVFPIDRAHPDYPAIEALHNDTDLESWLTLWSQA